MCLHFSRVTFAMQLCILSILSIALGASLGSIGEHTESLSCNKASWTFPNADDEGMQDSMDIQVLSSPREESSSTGLAAQLTRSPSFKRKTISLEEASISEPDQGLAIDRPIKKQEINPLGPGATDVHQGEALDEKNSEDDKASLVTQRLSPERTEAQRARSTVDEELENAYDEALKEGIMPALRLFGERLTGGNSRVPGGILINKIVGKHILRLIERTPPKPKKKVTWAIPEVSP